MNLRKIAGVLLSGALLVSLSSSLSLAETRDRHVQVQNIQYDARTGELLIDNSDQVPLTPQNVTHNPRRKEIVFYIPDSTVQPTPQVVQVKDDPIVRSIELTQRALEGIPAARVTIKLYTNAPYMPFMLTPQAPGLKLSFSRGTNPNAGVYSNEVKQPAVVSTPVKPPATTVSPRQGVVLQGQKPGTNSQALVIDPAKTNTMSFKASDKPLQAPNIINSVIGPVSPDAYSIIEDIFYEDNSLTVVSSKYPITVQRSFLLSEPNRYVVDISPAVLGSRSLINRAIPKVNPHISIVKAGQFDEKTVRIVVQFERSTMPVYLSQWEGNRVLKLSF
jgi:hypothetical protein